MKHLTIFAFCVALAMGAVSAAETPGSGPLTFTKDVLPILQENCQVCHRPAGKNMSGMVAPMSLMTYKEVRPWAKAIAQAVENRVMPPWHATAHTAGVFSNERTLDQSEIDTIVNWVKQGAKRGNPQDAPEPVTFPEGWYMGEPDLILSFPEPYFVEDDVQDLYHNVSFELTKEQLPEDRFVQAMEFKPGSEVVHHVIAYASGGDEGDDVRRRHHLGGLAPGTDAADYPEGYGKVLPAGSTFVFAMHYHKEPGPGTGRWDNTQVALKFHDDAVEHQLETSPIAYGNFEIPPNHPSWKVGGARIFDESVDVVALMPHMHLRGSSAKYTAYYPDGTTELLLDVPKYDFNWQTSYMFREIKHLPAGTRVEWEITYDNSEARAQLAGINPGRSVRFGQPTTDEMDLGWMTFAPSEPNVEAGD